MSKLHFILRNVTNNFDSWLVLFICIFVKGGIFVWPRISLIKLLCTKRLGVTSGIKKVEKGLTYFHSFDEERHCALWHPSYLLYPILSRFQCHFSFAILGFRQSCDQNKNRNYSMKKVKSLRYDRWLMYKQPCQESGRCCFSFARYLQKCVAQIYRALYGDAMFVSFWGTQMWRP